MPRLIPFSGLGTKGPACFLVEAAGARLLLDLGAGPDGDRRPDLASVGRVDAVLLSHAHPDHAGALDLLPALGGPPVHATPRVAAHVAGFGGNVAVRPDLPTAGTVEIAGTPVTTGGSGHAPGGVWLHLAVGRGLFYAGDMAFESALYAVDPPPPAATAVLDASYGTDDTGLAEHRAALEPWLDGRRVLFPVPAGGRGPELALAVLEATGRAPAICAAVRRVAEELVADGDGLVPGAAGRLARLLAAAPDSAGDPDGPVVAAKPNFTGGESARLARLWADRSDAAIVLTGHVGGGTPAEALHRRGGAVWRRWGVHPRLSDNARLARHLGARCIVPAFTPHNPALAGAWRRAMAPAALHLDGPLQLG